MSYTDGTMQNEQRVPQSAYYNPNSYWRFVTHYVGD